jgi:hypothetical protein
VRRIMRDRERGRMIISLRKWKERLRFLVLFLLLSFAAAHLFHWLEGWIAPEDPFRKPKGHAVKVFGETEGEAEYPSFAERLKLFYWYGA